MELECCFKCSSINLKESERFGNSVVVQCQECGFRGLKSRNGSEQIGALSFTDEEAKIISTAVQSIIDNDGEGLPRRTR